jgi:hypothetical protein
MYFLSCCSYKTTHRLSSDKKVSSRIFWHLPHLQTKPSALFGLDDHFICRSQPLQIRSCSISFVSLNHSTTSGFVLKLNLVLFVLFIFLIKLELEPKYFCFNYELFT